MDGFLRVDDHGRVAAFGRDLHQTLVPCAGCYRLSAADGTVLYFEKLSRVRQVEEARAPIIMQGDIAQMGSSIEVINFVGSSHLSGCLVLVNGDVRKWLYLKDGAVKGAGSNQNEDRLGEVLYRFGVLEREQLDQLNEQSRQTRRPLGNLLLETKILKQAELLKQVRHQVEEIFYSFLSWKEGDFFLTNFDVSVLPSPLTLSVQSLLMEGLRQQDELEHFRTKVKHDNLICYRIEGVQPSRQLDSSESCVYDTLGQGQMSVATLMRASKLGRFETIRALFALSQIGLCDFCEQNSVGIDQTAPQGVLRLSETDALIISYNSAFRQIFGLVSARGQANTFLGGFTTFLQFYGFTDLFSGVSFDAAGNLDVTQLAINLSVLEQPNQLAYLTQALRELLIFELFTVKAYLTQPEQDALQRVADALPA